MTEHDKAMRPEDITRLFVERSNAGDAAGVAALYEENAVLAYPPGSQTVGRDAIRDLWEKVLAGPPPLRARGAAADAGQRRHRPHLHTAPGRRRAPARRSSAASPTAAGCASSTSPNSSHPPTPRSPPAARRQYRLRPMS
ncbi:YybH family protein [Actinomadura madurae]|uniref:YybH family protein n=1 Tax=Actinomadura madurae TaxID=1993 RepID=UPI0020D207CF|nr:nuclear transport factor 2 family protein [Actinomadura madurae]MCP9976825.1 nuclear transport factor 2 family protein [Actinomadura madurae]